MAKKKSRAQIEKAETEGMNQAEMEEYMLKRDYITPELAAKYLGGVSGQGVRIQVRNKELPIAQFCLDGSMRISPERTIKYKHGDLVVDEARVTKAVIEAFARLPDIWATVTVETVREELYKLM